VEDALSVVDEPEYQSVVVAEAVAPAAACDVGCPPGLDQSVVVEFDAPALLGDPQSQSTDVLVVAAEAGGARAPLLPLPLA
jgi:hypothetical protein